MSVTRTAITERFRFDPPETATSITGTRTYQITLIERTAVHNGPTQIGVFGYVLTSTGKVSGNSGLDRRFISEPDKRRLATLLPPAGIVKS